MIIINTTIIEIVDIVFILQEDNFPSSSSSNLFAERDLRAPSFVVVDVTDAGTAVIAIVLASVGADVNATYDIVVPFIVAEGAAVVNADGVTDADVVVADNVDRVVFIILAVVVVGFFVVILDVVVCLLTTVVGFAVVVVSSETYGFVRFAVVVVCFAVVVVCLVTTVVGFAVVVVYFAVVVICFAVVVERYSCVVVTGAVVVVAGASNSLNFISQTYN